MRWRGTWPHFNAVTTITARSSCPTPSKYPLEHSILIICVQNLNFEHAYFNPYPDQAFYGSRASRHLPPKKTAKKCLALLKHHRRHRHHHHSHLNKTVAVLLAAPRACVGWESFQFRAIGADPRSTRTLAKRVKGCENLKKLRPYLALADARLNLKMNLTKKYHDINSHLSTSSRVPG